MHTDFGPIQERLKHAGFPVSGAVDFHFVSDLYHEHALRYQQWIQNGSHGEMAYLARGLDRRMDPRLYFPQIKSVIVVGRPYPAQKAGSDGIRYARYLNGPDYHVEMKTALETALQGEVFEYKICVDTSAVLERTWASLAGIGWIGKNTLLIHPQFGSFLFLGVIFASTLFGEKPRLHKDYCGTCVRCLEACPTQAFPVPHYLEARKCVSYLTLEKRGAWEKEFDAKGFIAGCDLCQEACPYNTKAMKYLATTAQAGHLNVDLEYLEKETEEEYRERVKGTSLARIKYPDFQRNLAGVRLSLLRKK